MKSFRLLIVCSVVLLNSCGFRLHGSASYPPVLANTYINAEDRYTVFYRDFSATLEQGGIQLVTSPKDATAVVRIERDQTGQKVLTVSGRNVPAEYDVYYTISYSVWVDGMAVLPSRTLSVSQDYTYDETSLLGKNREQEAIRKVIVKDLIRQVSQELSRLQ